MKIIQLVKNISYGDAISNDILALDKIIKKRGNETQIYSQEIDSRISKNLVKSFNELSVNKEDLILFHVGCASNLTQWIKNVECKKILIYHNITPPEFFEGYNPKAQKTCLAGIQQIADLKDCFDMALVCSDFSKNDLIKMGYSCPVKILPILIPFDDYKKEPSKEFIKKFDDDFTNIIFVGRIVPNKKYEDIIRAFDLYQKKYNLKSRLFITGNPDSAPSYDLELKAYVRKLGTRNVVFTGHTKFNEILAVYNLADLFLCMSEHEGFCVPLVEAMFFNIPIVAYSSSAVPDTLNGSGFLIEEKNPELTAGIINKIITDKNLKNLILKNQQERLNDFSQEKVENSFWSLIQDFIS